MIEIVGGLWNYYGKPGFVVCITTNGFVKKNGEAVMGRGCAKEAKLRFPGIAGYLGDLLKRDGNRFRMLGDPYHLVAFPVKLDWWENADPVLIVNSAAALRTEAIAKKDVTFILPRPGCGNGGLRWEEVGPLLEGILPDNVWVITKEEKTDAK